ncbi:Histone-lysine N-methyltransferase [Wickerhamomyces ciferrii]|uniref:Histone-lysine N-methyltransferase n=1 Tax=Wickerhamomyces ciferrii (strain ATCC 14091 / BCRC 22168 / CBS 111 / JCM 3599 / NBRC 0793 / NRRL Y-1031 F-60-10) TaxID=1206466 RepID=K0KME1_WICCF|nr:Histone-lysine N-methyltransferase [Wickerhamomyces ciferrii]CCH42258.1 Histone-lysine N-methyltransferase [Wickerhamomyces ciferrii]
MVSDNDLDLDYEEPVQYFPQRVSRRSAKKNYWKQISDFFQNSFVPEFDDSLLIEAVEDCAEWKRYTEQDVDDIEILYERNNGKGRVLSTLSSDDEDDFIHRELEKFKLDGKLWVLSGLFQAPYTDKKKKFEFALPQGKGLKVLNTVQDFKLPWNIYCPTIDGERNIVKWKHGLKRNQWLLENPFIAKKQVNEVCSCTGVRCGSTCLNRSVQIECTPNNCKFGDQDCGNRAFADLMNAYRDHSKYAFGCEVLQTDKKGCGLLSIRSFNAGSLVVEYTGEVIHLDEVEHRLNTIYKESDSYYFLGLEEEYVIDAGQKGSVARFANHSCDPNAEMQKWYVNGEPRIGLFAKRSIEAGEEITYDYNFEWFENGEPQKCYCGSKNCHGFIGKAPNNEDDSDDEPADKRGIKVSHPSKATTIYSSDSSSDSDLEDFDQVDLVEALENFNHDYDANKAKLNNKNSKGKYSPGAKLKEVMVGEDNKNNNKENIENNKSTPKKANTSESKPLREEFEKQSTKLKQPEQKTSNVRGAQSQPPADPRKQPSKRNEAKKTTDSSRPSSKDTSSTRRNNSPYAPEYPDDKPVKRTSRRNMGAAFTDLDPELAPQLKNSFAINMAPPGGKTDIKEQVAAGVQSTQTSSPPKTSKKAAASPPKNTNKTPSSPPKKKPASTSASASKKRSEPSAAEESSQKRKKPKLIIDTSSEESNESDDEPISKSASQKAPEKNGNARDSSSDSSNRITPIDQKAFKEAKESKSSSHSSTKPTSASTTAKKSSVFGKRRDPISRKTEPVEKSSSPVKQPASFGGSEFFNLKKAKRNQNQAPVQTTESYQSSPPTTASSNAQPSAPSHSNAAIDSSYRPTAESSELVVHESAQNYVQPAGPHTYDHYYDNWNGYYEDPNYHNYYYGDQYYQQYPPYQGQHYPPQPQPQPQSQPAYGEPSTSTAVASPKVQPSYPEGYYQPQRPQPGYPTQEGYPYYPPPPQPRGYPYYPPPPQPRGYPYGPPPPQPYPTQPGGAYGYAQPYGAAPSYPPGAFSADAENEMLVESPQEAFADEVLEQSENEQEKKKDGPDIPADPRRRKK